MFTMEKLQTLFDSQKTNILKWDGNCFDCTCDIVITTERKEKETEILGGAIYRDDLTDSFYFKCDNCYKKEKKLMNYQPCEVYSRIVGYLRPTSQWNEGKQSEFKDRKMFNLKGENKNGRL